ELTKTLDSTSTIYGLSGDRLPYSSPFSAHADVSQDFPIGQWTGFVGAAFDYVGKRYDVFSSKDPVSGLPSTRRLAFAGYSKVDLKGGIRAGRFATTVYVNNVTDKRGILASGYQISAGHAEAQFIQPLTIGLNIVGSF